MNGPVKTYVCPGDGRQLSRVAWHSGLSTSAPQDEPPLCVCGLQLVEQDDGKTSAERTVEASLSDVERTAHAAAVSWRCHCGYETSYGTSKDVSLEMSDHVGIAHECCPACGADDHTNGDRCVSGL